MIKKIITIIALITLLAGCSSTGIKDLVERPKVSIQDVKMGKLTLSGGSARFLLKIENPNRFPIPLQGFDYGLRLNGVEVANGNREQKVTIAGGESKVVEVPLVFSFSNMMSLLPNVLGNRSLKYDLKGSIHFPWFNLPFNRSGGTSLSR
ncbi:MAG: LEA type 2 family protein [Cocleimonas sp.]|nr:LEA type 2 family protein [Cocleimonas sp.]